MKVVRARDESDRRTSPTHLPFRCSGEEASVIAEDLRRTVNALAPTLAGIPFPVATISISVGVACGSFEPRKAIDGPFDADMAGRALFRAADEALYAAK